MTSAPEIKHAPGSAAVALSVNPHVAALPPYNAGMSLARARAVSGHHELARLASNENPDGCSPSVLAALTSEGFEPWRYADPACTTLREALAQRLDVSTDVIVVGNGSEEMIAAISRGTPRVVNTLCDRALDVAFERHLRVVDAESVAGAAARLHLDNPGQLAEAGGRRFTWFVIALILILGALVATWLWLPKPPTLIQSPGGTPPTRASVAPTPSRPSPSPSSSSATGSAPAVPALGLPGSGSPAGGARSTTPGVSDAGTASAPVAPLSVTPTTPASASGSAAARPGSYQITVASFRTEQRAQDVAATISKQQVPAVVRTDATGTWFQVIAGPFASREAAVAAQSQIALNGFQGTQVSPVVADVH